MKQVFCVFLFLIMFSQAFADPTPVAGEPTHADPATTATAQPGYALVNSDTTNDAYAATAGYVKGAYNAAIKAVNTVANTIPTSEPSSATNGRATIWVE